VANIRTRNRPIPKKTPAGHLRSARDAPTHRSGGEQPRQSARSGMAGGVVQAAAASTSTAAHAAIYVRACIFSAARQNEWPMTRNAKGTSSRRSNSVPAGYASHLHRRHERNSEKELGGGYQTGDIPVLHSAAPSADGDHGHRGGCDWEPEQGISRCSRRYSRARRSYAPRRRRCGRRATRTRNSRQSESR